MDNDRDFPNSGILFRNDRKQEDRHPDYNGTADVDCPQCGPRTHWRLASWIKQGRKGKFMSLTATPGRRFGYKHQACWLPELGMARINRPTCSGSSNWTKC